MLPPHESTEKSHAFGPTLRFGFILTRGYALMSVAAAVEPLRAANHLAGRELYKTRFFSGKDGFVASTAEGGFFCESLDAIGSDLDIVFVVAGGNPMAYEEPALTRGLRRLASRGIRLGGISGGAAVLARHGLMAGRRFTVHWQHIDALRSLSSDLLVERTLYVIDRDRYTCAGGVAALDMMHALIAQNHGAIFARSVSDWFIHTRVRTSSEPQQSSLAEQFNVSHPALEAAIQMIMGHLADPLTTKQLALLSGVSKRQLQRLFRENLGQPIMHFYRARRLEKADELLQQSTLPVIDIAISTGFANVAHFTRCFAEQFHETPAKRRRILHSQRTLSATDGGEK